MVICLRYSKDEETAYDLLHDGFIQVFRISDLLRARIIRGLVEAYIRKRGLIILAKRTKTGRNQIRYRANGIGTNRGRRR